MSLTDAAPIATELLMDGQLTTNRAAAVHAHRAGAAWRPELDLARGVATMAMVGIHTLMVLGAPHVEASAYGQVLHLISELGGIFILVMGVLASLRPTFQGIKFVRRGIELWLLGYVLNFFKFVVPLKAWHSLPSAFLADIGAPASEPVWFLLLIGDILQLAGISLLLMAALRRVTSNVAAPFVAASVFASVGPWLWGLESGSPLLDHFLSLLWGADNKSYFPVFPWAAFPLLGMGVGALLYRTPSVGRFYRRTAVVAAVAFIAGLTWMAADAQQLGDFHRMGLGGVLHYGGFIILALCMAHAVSTWLPHGPTTRFLHQAGRDILRIYVAQWILIMWSVAVIDYRSLEAVPLTLASVVLYFSSITSAKAWRGCMKKLQRTIGSAVD